MGTGKRRPRAAVRRHRADAGRRRRRRRLLAGPAPARAADTVRGLQWYLDPLKIPQAHKLSRGKGVVVAVVDSGVYAAHPDLKGQVLPGKGSAPTRPRRPQRSGRAEGPRHGDGRVIAGRGGGVMHELGIAPEAKILPVGLGADDRNADIAAGIRWAADHGADVINVSLANDSLKRELADAIRYALSKDAVVVAGAGNVDAGHGRRAGARQHPGRRRGRWHRPRRGPVGRFGDRPGAGAGRAGGADHRPRPPTVSPNGYVVNDRHQPRHRDHLGRGRPGPVALPGPRRGQRGQPPDPHRPDEGPSGRDPRYGFGVVDPLAALTRSVPPVCRQPAARGRAAGADHQQQPGQS